MRLASAILNRAVGWFRPWVVANCIILRWLFQLKIYWIRGAVPFGQTLHLVRNETELE
jgi:hypothetical protein